MWTTKLHLCFSPMSGQSGSIKSPNSVLSKSWEQVISEFYFGPKKIRIGSRHSHSQCCAAAPLAPSWDRCCQAPVVGANPILSNSKGNCSTQWYCFWRMDRPYFCTPCRNPTWADARHQESCRDTFHWIQVIGSCICMKTTRRKTCLQFGQQPFLTLEEVIK